MSLYSVDVYSLCALGEECGRGQNAAVNSGRSLAAALDY